jgi:glycosyltransferase involved in cell wall biosynthesis
MPFDQSSIQFSILILSIPSRFDKFKKIFDKLQTQCGKSKNVEILALIDNKSKHIADKRNDLLQAAQGKYIAFLDDDDDISDDYISSIIEVITNTDVDIITFNQKCSIDGEEMNVSFDMGNAREGLSRTLDNKLKNILRPPYHICVWRTDIAKTEKFERIYSSDGQSSEDYHWTKRLYPKIKTEQKINKILHHYIYETKTTESILK